MQSIHFNQKNSGISPILINSTRDMLKEHTASLSQSMLDATYGLPESFMYTPFDCHARTTVKEMAARYNPDAVFLIGIGGSNLGALAVMAALTGVEGPQLYTADTIDDNAFDDLKQQAQMLLDGGKKIVCIIISKSGSTMETVINASLFIDLLNDYKQPLADSVVVITDAGSRLESYARAHEIPLLTIPVAVGGRYSVFTAAGLFPLALCGVNIDALCRGAADESRFEWAADSAAIIYNNYREGRVIHDIFTFAPEFALLGAWYRQLMGESLGKITVAEPFLPTGITPTVSIGTTDLHSVAQLYLSGPNISFTTFIARRYIASHTIPIVSGLTPHEVAGKTLAEVKTAIFTGVRTAYEQMDRRFCVIEFDVVDAQTIGAFLYGKMIEIVYLGRLLGVNPFDQPQVELYKQNTQAILAKTKAKST